MYQQAVSTIHLQQAVLTIHVQQTVSTTTTITGTTCSILHRYHVHHIEQQQLYVPERRKQHRRRQRAMYL